MATDVQPEATVAPIDADRDRRPYRFTAEQFWRMIRAGIFPESHVELVRGRIYLMTKYEPHGFTTRSMTYALRDMMPDGVYVRREEAMRYDSSTVLEPDLAIVPGRENVFQPDPPLASEALWIVEICATTHWADYRQKLNLYAAAGVPVYWIVDVEGRKIDVFTQPRGVGREAGYDRRETFAEGSPVPVVLDGREVGRLDAQDLLPPVEKPEPPKPLDPTA